MDTVQTFHESAWKTDLSEKKVAEVGELIVQPCREICQHMGGGHRRDERRGDVAASLQGHAVSRLQS